MDQWNWRPHFNWKETDTITRVKFVKCWQVTLLGFFVCFFFSWLYYYHKKQRKYVIYKCFLGLVFETVVSIFHASRASSLIFDRKINIPVMCHPPHGLHVSYPGPLQTCKMESFAVIVKRGLDVFFFVVVFFQQLKYWTLSTFNPLSANLKKWLNTLKQFVG